MHKIIRLLTVILFYMWIILNKVWSGEDGQHVNLLLENYGIITNPNITTANTTIGSKTINGYKTNFMNGIFEMFTEIPCDATIKFSYNLMRNNKYSETPFYERIATLGDLAKFENDSIGRGMSSGRKCFTPQLKCPWRKGRYVANECMFPSTLNTLLFAKTWNISFVTRLPDSTLVSQWWFIFIMDDSNVLRLKRPTAAQRARQEKQNRRTTSNATLPNH